MAEAAEQPRDEVPLEAGAEEAVKIICLGDSAVGKSKYVAPRAPRRRARPGGAPDGRGVSPQAAREVPARRIVSAVPAAPLRCWWGGREAGGGGGGDCSSDGSLTRAQPPPAALHLRPDAVPTPSASGREGRARG